VNNSHGIAKEEESSFQKYLELITMIDTVPFTLKRFKFHVELFNRYQALEGLDDSDTPACQDILNKYNVKDSECSNQDSSSLDKANKDKQLSKSKYLKLLPSFKVTSVDMDIGVGNWR
jgi:hypothetical protein